LPRKTVKHLSREKGGRSVHMSISTEHGAWCIAYALRRSVTFLALVVVLRRGLAKLSVSFSTALILGNGADQEGLDFARRRFFDSWRS
jgi:hypothetical protein